MPSHRSSIARELARALLADLGDGGGSDAAALGARLAATLGTLPPWARAIAEDEGFRLHPRKTRCMPQHRRQSVGGIVVNARPNAPRDEVDRLRALLHRCVHDGPHAHNRDAQPDFGAHLLGRIAWVAQLNPRRGAKLRTLDDRIRWPL